MAYKESCCNRMEELQDENVSFNVQMKVKEISGINNKNTKLTKEVMMDI